MMAVGEKGWKKGSLGGGETERYDWLEGAAEPCA